MNVKLTSLVVALSLAAPALAQQGVEGHLAAAKTAAGSEFQGLYAATCGREFAPPAAPATAVPPGAPARPAGPPPRAQWYAPPQKVFDDLYWLGTREHSAWALTTSDGIILIDTLYAYAVEAEIVDGLKALGLDPARVKYVIISHAHGDHDQGAKLMQDRFGAQIVMGAADWDSTERNPNRTGGVPKRGIAVSTTQPLTLGGTTVTLVPTPGHTPGTLSLLFPVRDKGHTLTVAYSGGTAFNFTHTRERFDTYVASQRKIGEAATAARATVILSNHSAFDHALEKAPLTQRPRAAGAPNPFELGPAAVQRYFKVLETCAVATRLKEFGD